ncbi:hypothetical protein ES703_98914 [subsurface metagenome]
MVIIFENEKARNHLLKESFVFTFRKKKRKRTGNDWMTNMRGGFKVADVDIEEIGCWTGMAWLSILKSFVEHSGFSTEGEWLVEIVKLNKGLMPKKGWIYGVRLR